MTARHLPAGVSVVVPVYQGEACLAELCQRLAEVLEARGTPFELILVDDGSADGSWGVIEALTRRAELMVRGIRLSRNYGQHNALLCGIGRARYATLVTLDDDLQNPPEEVPRLVEALSPDVDVVYGAPERQQHGLLRALASRLTKLVLQHAMGAETASRISAFRAFRTALRGGFAHYSGSFVSIDVLLTWTTTRFRAITVRHEPRRVGPSGYTFRKLLVHALNMVTGFSIVPLQLASLVGFLCTLFGVGVLVWVVGRALIEGIVVPGFAFLASIIAIFSGAQLFSLGILGEYLARVHFRSQERPVYLVREERGGGEDEPVA